MSSLTGRGRICGVLSLVFIAATLICGRALAAEAPAGGISNPADLLHAWLSFPDAVDVHWPYAFITTKATAKNEKKTRKALMQEFDQLHWRLESFGYPKLADTVTTWRKKIENLSVSRVPGDWSPAFLLAHPNHRPPIDRISSIGACQVPTSVGVWSASGYQAVPWHSGMRLSTLEKMDPSLRKGSAPEIAVVDPYGNIDHYGVESWNYADGFVAPGSQVIASLPLKGEAFEWIRDTIADLLAHAPSGVNCRHAQIEGETASDDSGS